MRRSKSELMTRKSCSNFLSVSLLMVWATSLPETAYGEALAVRFQSGEELSPTLRQRKPVVS